MRRTVCFRHPEVVEDGLTGTLVDDDDPDAMAAAIGGLLADPDVYQRVAQQREALLGKHDWSTIAASMVEGMHRLATAG